jgi:hypothetical protein
VKIMPSRRLQPVLEMLALGMTATSLASGGSAHNAG